ncbi:MAG: tyrosyl-tRNA synthetase [Bogoriella megaspora]|nr:MAG: tyrosyl-tRNA synthetase [Bogoriella megaspora]
MMERVGILWERFKDHAVHRGHKNLGINIVKDNADWGQDLTVEKFLHYLGTNVRLGAMLSRDTVKTRMESGNGMSYAEFTYPLLQAWDFRHLYLTHGVQLQIGGSDQYGNIVAGIEAAKQSQEEPNTARKTGPTDAPYGLTVPLLTTPSGAKFGKSAGNAVWLDEKRTSVFDLYGFMLSTPDASVAQYLKLFTFLPVATISATMTVQESDPSARPAQHLLAYELVSLVHGASAADEARAQHSLIFSSRSSTPASTSSTANSSIFALKPSAILPLSYILRTPISRLLMHADLNVQTRSEATRLIASGGCYLGRENEGGGLEFERLENAKMLLREEDLTRNGEGKMRVIVRRGKTLVKVLEVLEDVEFERRGLGRPGV